MSADRPDGIDIGILLPSAVPARDTLEIAKLADQAGISEVWIPEDFGCHGGIALAGAVLASTDLRVGIGISAIGVRHVGLLAQEVASLRGMFGDRFTPGFGLGVKPHLAPLGIFPKAQLDSMRSHVEVLRGLLAGEVVTGDTGTSVVKSMQLKHPCAQPVPIHLAALGPKMLALSGEVADGTVGSICSGAEWVRWARQRIDEGNVAVRPHRVTIYSLASMDDDSSKAIEAITEPLARTLGVLLDAGLGSLIQRSGVEDLESLNRARRDPAQMNRLVADELSAIFSITGDREAVVRRIREYRESGADCLVLSGGTFEGTASLISHCARWFPNGTIQP